MLDLPFANVNKKLCRLYDLEQRIAYVWFYLFVVVIGILLPYGANGSRKKQQIMLASTPKSQPVVALLRLPMMFLLVDFFYIFSIFPTSSCNNFRWLWRSPPAISIPIACRCRVTITTNCDNKRVERSAKLRKSRIVCWIQDWKNDSSSIESDSDSGFWRVSY